MQILDQRPPAGLAGLLDRSKATGAGTQTDANRFSDLLSAAQGNAAAPDTAKPGAQEDETIARMQKELDAYKRERDEVVRNRTSVPPAFQIALPATDQGYVPFVTPDQQALLDRITDRYIGRPQQDFEKMWEELDANGVGPQQLARTAKYFVGPDGDVVSRAVAMGGGPSTKPTSTAWMASAL
ncbi:hypothetical protein [Azospirillum agricola]|uniref:hypothetical protein n=1 Tax=Azospirillum agricola TaxID=1720247 RepID=UPI000A0F3D6F|nr:hypothetical protein [Azospirillum agricola]SMH60551.1 hypothetical protein SAMN02982994_5576 [Azospirillum lipoferum]